MNFKLFLYIPVVLYLAMFSSAWGDVYYVRPAGSTYGASSGLSYEDAFAGLSVVNERIGSGVFVAGDTIYLCDTFTNEYLSLELLAGAPENLITIRGDYPGHPGRISTNLNYAIRLNNTSYVRLYSLELERTGEQGGYGISGINAGVNDHVIMDKINSHGWHSGIMLGYTNHEVLNCELYGNSYNGIHATGNGIRIHHNFIHDNGTFGINGDGIFIDAGSDSGGEYWVYNNTVVNQSGSDGAALIDSTNSSSFPQTGHIYNNSLSNCPNGYAIGILGGEAYATADDKYFIYGNVMYKAYWMLTLRDTGTVYFFNNTVVRETMNGQGLYPMFVWAEDSVGSRHLYMKNNIFAGPAVYGVRFNSNSGASTIESDYNNWFTAPETAFARIDGAINTWSKWVETLHDVHSSTGDPQFVNQAAADFKLQSTSPAIDAGTDICSILVDAKDMSGNAICAKGAFSGFGKGMDMGCYESYSYPIPPTGLSLIYCLQPGLSGFL